MAAAAAPGGARGSGAAESAFPEETSKLSALQTQEVLSSALDALEKQLYERVMPFWLRHSLDRKHGGYWNCLTDEGVVYDTTKHVWMQARQVWMLSKLYNCDARFHTAEVLAAARLGADFLRAHGLTPDRRRAYFSLTAAGKPLWTQRKLFAECFFVMGMVEFARASGDASFDQVGLEVFRHVLDYAFHPEKLGRPSLEGQRPASALNVPMIVLNVIDEIRDQEADKARQQWFEEEAQWCVAEILKHVKPEAKMVYEEVGADGAVLDDTSAGRLLNPGHAIEAGWFLMHHEQLCDRLAGKPARRGAEAGPLSALGVRMIEWSFDAGWDPAHGGLFYFLDSKGFSPSQLEWNMKLWWPHCESLVGTLMAFRFGGDRRHLDRFLRTLNYTLAHFACTPHGEWYGYLDREGRVTHRLVGGAYKCCFHVPRALMLCTTMLREMVGAAKDAAGK